MNSGPPFPRPAVPTRRTADIRALACPRSRSRSHSTRPGRCVESSRPSMPLQPRHPPLFPYPRCTQKRMRSCLARSCPATLSLSLTLVKVLVRSPGGGNNRHGAGSDQVRRLLANQRRLHSSLRTRSRAGRAARGSDKERRRVRVPVRMRSGGGCPALKQPHGCTRTHQVEAEISRSDAFHGELVLGGAR